MSHRTFEGVAGLGDRFRTEGLIGTGGSAEVLRAHDLLLDRPVAIKRLKAEADTPLHRHRIADEARLLARLQHHHLARLLDVGHGETGLTLVLDLVPGPDLASALTGGPLPPARVAEIGADLAAGLAHVHARRLVHCDVKPANIVFDDHGRAVLVDFGIARDLDEPRTDPVGITVGTVAYLAPEQVHGSAPVTRAADVYSLGLVLLEALTGRREYAGTTEESAGARLHRTPGIPTSLPSGWSALLAAMTASDPDARPVIADLRHRLRDLARRHRAAATPALTPAAAVVPTAREGDPSVDPAPTGAWTPQPADVA